MAIRIDIQVGSKDTFQGFAQVQNQLRSLKTQQDEVRKMSGGSSVVNRFATALDRLGNSAEKAADNLKAVNLQMSILRSLAGAGGAVNTGVSGSGGGGNGRASSARQIANRAPAPPPILDPDQAQRQAALMQGTDPAKAVKLHNQANAARKRIAKQQAANDPDAMLYRILMRTRLSKDPNGKIKGNMLGVDYMALMKNNMGGIADQIISGGGAAGGADALSAASSAIAGIKGLGPAAIAVSAQLGIAAAYIQSVNSQVRTRAQIGGSARESLAAATIASAIGLGPNAANQLSSNIAGGGTAATEASKAGINLVRGPYGDTNDAKAFNQAVEYVARSKSFEEARQKAVRFGSPELASAYYLSENTRKRLAEGSGGTEEDAKTAAEFNAEMAILTREFQRAVLAGRPLIQYFSTLARTFSNLTEPLQWLIKLGTWSPASAVSEFANRNRGGAKNPQTEAINRNTRATEDNTRATNGVREVMGGGARAQSALPSKLGPSNMRSAMDRIELGLI